MRWPINDPNLNVAVFDRIITSTNRMTLRPTTMAHEIGHLVALEQHLPTPVMYEPDLNQSGVGYTFEASDQYRHYRVQDFGQR